MIEWNNFYGAILIDREYEKSKDFIVNRILEKKYNYFHPAIFSTGIQEYPYYYDDILFSFGRTAKYFACDLRELQDFITEFEDILSNLDFKNAQVRMDTDYANYDLFWRNKTKLTEQEQLEDIKQYSEYGVRYFESEKFYFGIGEIDLYTGWVENYSKEKLTDFDSWYGQGFNYPF